MDAQISNVGHLYKILKSKTFMLFGSHSASKGQERLKKSIFDTYRSSIHITSKL
jgi:hypothetical protein